MNRHITLALLTFTTVLVSSGAVAAPANASGYHTSADPNGSIPGENVWNLEPPNGTISIGDLGAAVAQFGA